MKSTNGQSWKVERTRIRNRHRGFFRIRIRKFQNSNSNRPARGGSIIRDWKANQKTAIKEKSLAKAKSLPVLGIEFCHTTGWYYRTRSLESWASLWVLCPSVRKDCGGCLTRSTPVAGQPYFSHLPHATCCDIARSGHAISNPGL